MILMNSRRTSLQFPCICGIAAFFLLAGAGCSPSPEKPKVVVPRPAPVDMAILSEGERVYNEVCAQCHLAGEGAPGLNPPLIGSPILKGPPGPAIQNVLKGSKGQSVVNGQKFTGIMLPLDYLTDDEVAAVLSYVRQKYAEHPDPLVTPKMVEAER